MKFFQLWIALWFVALKELHLSVSVIVKFPNKKPLYVALNKTLVLEADFQLQQSEKVLLQTWERKNRDGEIRVAESGRGNNERISVEKNGALLKITGVTESDYGVYKFTVTVNNGDQVSDSREVLKIINPPNASLYMQCSIPSVDAQWDKPAFSWQVNGRTIDNKNGEISEDGGTLHLTNLGQNYTCITDSSQGTSKVEVRINEQHCPTCHVWIVFAVIELIIICVLVGFYLYKRLNEEPVL